MPFTKSFLEEVKQRNNIVDVISRYVSLKRAGSNMVGCCPFHNEKTPSFTVFPATSSYYCFGCGAGGDAITFVMQTEGLDYPDAVRELAKTAGVPVEEVENDTSVRPAIRKERVVEINTAAARFFRTCLFSPQGEEARQYLKKRQFSDQTVKRFGIGYAPNSWDELCKHLTSQGFSTEEIQLSFLGSKSQKSGKLFDIFRNRLMFPVFDLSGDVVAFSGRRLNETDERKYINSSDTPVFKKSRILFGMNFAKNNAEQGLILCEGAPDCIAMHQAGFENACATLGTAITGEHARLIARFTKQVYLAYDIDKAGRKATMRGIDLLNQVGVDTKIISLGEGDSKDPDEFIKNHGAAAFRQKLTGSQGQIDYRIGEILSRYQLENPDEKLRCSNEMTGFIATISNHMEREIYASRAAEKLSISPETLRDAVEKKARSLQAQIKKQEQVKTTERQMGYDNPVNRDKIRFSTEAIHEEAILGILLLHPEFGKEIAGQLKPDDFATDFNRKLWELFSNDFENGTEPEINADGTLDPREIGALEGYRASRATIGNGTVEELEGHIQALKAMQEKKNYDKKLEENPVDALDDFLKQIREKQDSGNKQ